ncbi:hypothetical protein [Chryseobacterium hispalense]|uniref:hypothetical protein n=1 Tax=Chryseobacterium hispalense TaxID=1453492 RepID=UPI003919E2AF
MMRKKISWLFLLTVFLTLFSCRNEQDILNEVSANRKRDIISFAAFQKETQIQKVGEVISPLSISQKNNQNDDPLSGFLIDTETINRIKANGDISTYAFRIYSLFGNPHDVYNMVYRKRNDGTLHYSIIRIKGNTPYVLYDSEAASSAQKYAAKNSTAKTSSHEDCAASYSVSIWHCKNGHSWETCDKCPECLETLTVCVGSGGGDNSGGFGNPSDGNPSDPPPPLDPFSEGGSAAYLTDPSGYVFDPNVPPSTDAGYVRALRAYLFWEQLPGALYRQWANEHVDIYQNIIESYLNNYSIANNTENLDFHNQAVQYFMDHPNATWDEFYNQYLSADSPCKKIKDKFVNPKFKEKYQELNTPAMLSMDHEKGYYERLPPVGTIGVAPSFVVSEGAPCTTGMDLPPNKDGIIGLMHIHTDEDCNGNSPIKKPSPADVRTFLNRFMKQSKDYTGSYSSAYSVIITSQGSYMLQYNSEATPPPTWDLIHDWMDWYKKEYEKLIKNDELTQINAEKVFTQFLKEVVNVAGLEIYRITETTSTKLDYNPNTKTLTTIPCP